jgi:hypothetical protein
MKPSHRRIWKMHCWPGQIGLVSRVGVRCIGEFRVEQWPALFGTDAIARRVALIDIIIRYALRRQKTRLGRERRH